MAFNEDDDITEMKSLEVDRVDAVGAPANGTGWLVLKAADPDALPPALNVGGAGSVSYTVAGGVGGTFTTGDISVGGGGVLIGGGWTIAKAKYSADQLRALYKQGHAMKGPHGNIDYPIADDEDLHNAIRAVGRGNAPHGKIRSYIEKRAKALGHTDWIPDTWTGGTSKETEEGGWRMSKHAEKAIGVPSDAMPAVTAPAVATNPIGESSAAPAGAPPATETAALPTDGDSSSLGPQPTDPNALEGQTMENCTPVAGGSGDQQGRQDAQTQKAKKKGKKKRSMHNPQHPDTDADPDADASAAKAVGDPQWQSTDVSLGEGTIDKLQQALSLAQQFTHREKTEAEDAAAVKEIHMTQDELVRLATLIGDAAKRDAKKAAKKEAKKAAEAAAQAVQGTSLGEDAAKRLADVEGRLETVESQPARSRPILSGAAGPVDAGTAFKALEDSVEAAKARHDVVGAMSAAKRLTTAKLMSIENARRDGRLPQPADLPDGATPILTGSHLLPADPHIRGI